MSMLKGLDNNQENEASQSNLQETKLELVELPYGTTKQVAALVLISLEAINNNVNNWKQLYSIV